MKKLLSSAFALLLIVSAATAQDSYKETRNVTGFDEVSFCLAGEVYISLGQGFQGCPGRGQGLYTMISRQKLPEGSLSSDLTTGSIPHNKKVIVRITMPALNGIDVSGSGKVTVT